MGIKIRRGILASRSWFGNVAHHFSRNPAAIGIWNQFSQVCEKSRWLPSIGGTFQREWDECDGRFLLLSISTTLCIAPEIEKAAWSMQNTLHMIISVNVGKQQSHPAMNEMLNMTAIKKAGNIQAGDRHSQRSEWNRSQGRELTDREKMRTWSIWPSRM